MINADTLILGSGPTGLGAAWRLNEIGEKSWLLIDKNDYPGGLAASFYDHKGFTWDFAIHVAHSHYDYFDKLMDKLLPDGFYNHQRKAWVRLCNTWVPYPFQYNFHRLPPKIKKECLDGLIKRNSSIDNKTFLSWINSNFGEGIAKHFMVPYNKKIWSVEPSEMSSEWLGERVPEVDIKKIKNNYKNSIDELGWGPNASFKFPKNGGTGSIWKKMYELLPDQNKKLKTEILSIDPIKKIALLSDNTKVQYKYLISTIPINNLAELLKNQNFIQKTQRLKRNQVVVVGMGVFQKIPDELNDKTWIYCPEKTAGFYRLTPFSNLSDSHTPDNNKNCSFLCEFSEKQGAFNPHKDYKKIAIEGIRNLGIMDINQNKCHFVLMRSSYGYPIPTLDRDEILHEILPELESLSIYSRGRFGGWKYEVSNMDHSVMQGVEAVNHILNQSEQPTIYTPKQINK